MHENSMQIMSDLFDKYATSKRQLRILDVGSYDVNGSYRELVESRNHVYLGLDVRPGPNVDVTAPKNRPYYWLNAVGGSLFDIVISGSTIEHVQDPFSFAMAVHRVLDHKGKCFLVAPGDGADHHRDGEYEDYWRILPAGMAAVIAYGSMRVVETGKKIADGHNDTYGVGEKR